MTVTPARGFRVASVRAGSAPGDGPDVVLVVNDGPSDAAAAVFGSSPTGSSSSGSPAVESSNPELWSERAVADGRLRAVVLDAGGANRGTGPEGFAVTHATAEDVAGRLGVSAFDVLVGSTGPDGTRADGALLRAGVAAAVQELTGVAPAADDETITNDEPITDGEPMKDDETRTDGGWTLGVTVLGDLVVITTDADVAAPALADALSGTTVRVGTTVLMASGAAGVVPDAVEFAGAVRALATDGVYSR